MYLDLKIFWYLYSKTGQKYEEIYIFFSEEVELTMLLQKAMSLQVQNIETKIKVMHKRVILR